jgi:hypothetical protein
MPIPEEPTSIEPKHSKKKRSHKRKNRIVVEETCTATTVSIEPAPCCHANGTYRSIPARLFGRRDVFVCADCASVLDAKTKERL